MNFKNFDSFSDFENFAASLLLPSPLEPFTPDWEGAEHVSMYVKRDDSIHPVISGNKWRKLKYAFDIATSHEINLGSGSGKNTDLSIKRPSSVVSFGGGFSNHLHALGYLCNQLNIPFHAIIRGDYTKHPSPMIRDLVQWGTLIHYVNKITYQQRDDPNYLASLRTQFPDALIIPEGGSQMAALKGVQEVVDEIDIPFDRIIAPVASGATLAGLTSALSPHQCAIGIGVLKGEGYLEGLVEQFLTPADSPVRSSVACAGKKKQFSINHDYHCGGYGKVPPYLQTFCEDFNRTMPFDIEGVYSGKVFWALKNLLATHACQNRAGSDSPNTSSTAFEKGHTLIIVHTGGIQGARKN
ncbi:cysteine desulfhydrase [Alteromonas sp. 1_MG-2023]|uniref:1-aminocyclopropane-1-carboxylate deaminase/D-cysteine desulfhydrase n=1 Tax=Alteromonas sp. 1_MG-2023 TaxID=3062669 RepID=UPI0026E440D6|nr:cysteine desulfhydrase [Alteromonas sp. 1_MG-2023]MDO6568382.1 cysteine desulfhydrase [Alteromonas sp. 1_MG-2023]